MKMAEAFCTKFRRRDDTRDARLRGNREEGDPRHDMDPRTLVRAVKLGFKLTRMETQPQPGSVSYDVRRDSVYAL